MTAAAHRGAGTAAPLRERPSLARPAGALPGATPAARAERRDGVQVIARAADVLRELAAEPGGLTPAELAVRTGLARSTCHRITSALSGEGFVGVSASGHLSVGPGLIGLAVASRRELRLEVAPYLERLSHELRETVDLAVLDGGEVLFVDQYASRRTLRIVSDVGARFPSHCTANGKALLARLAPDELAAVLPARLERLTPATITSRRRLLDELALVRATGLAFDREECSQGICAVGATVCDAAGSPAAITIVVPASRFSGSEGSFAAALLRVRDDVQRVLGMS